MTPVLLTERPTSLITAPPEDATRREFITGVGAAALAAAFLAACGSEDEASAEASATTAGKFPRTVKHGLGSTTIDAEPKRIVALIDRDADTLLAMGITPVGIRSNYGFEEGVGPWAVDELGDATPTVWTGRELDLEAIAAAQPDLLVFTVSGGDVDEYNALSGIAPTLALPEGAVAWGATPEQSLRLIAEALGREEEAEGILADFDTYLQETATQYPVLKGKSFAYFDIFQGGVTNYGGDHIVNSIMYRIGFVPSAGTEAMTESSQAVSVERLIEYDADIILAYPFGSTLEELKAAIPTLASMSSVAEGRFFLLEDLAFSNSSLLSIPYALDNLLPRISAALSA